jgi:tetratricopeptide (TPR) repeat protein
LGMAQTIGDKRDEAGALNNLANIRDSLGDAAGAIRDYQQSIAVAKERGSLSDLALAQQSLAVIFYTQGEQQQGEDAFREAIKIANQIGDRKTEARALTNKCGALLSVGKLKDARESCQESLKLRRAMNDQAAIASSLGATGDVQLTEGDVQGARQNYTEALRIQEQLGLKADAATSRKWLGWLALQDGKVEEARAFAQDSANEFATEKDVGNEGFSRALLAEALLASGDMTGARVQLETSRKLAESAKDRGLTAQVALVQAKIDSQSGDADNAIRSLQKLEKEARKNGELADALEACVALGQAQLKAGRTVEGRKTLASAAQEAKSKGLGLIEKRALAASKAS